MTDEEIRLQAAEYPSVSAASRGLGIPRTNLRRILAKVVGEVVSDLPDPKVMLPPQGFVVKSNSVGYDQAGEVKAQWVGMIPAPGESYQVPQGHVVKGESALLNPEGKVLAKWVKTKERTDADDLVGSLVSAFSKIEGTAPLGLAPLHADEDLHTVYPLADLHLGMHSWGQETNEAYDMDIAIHRARTAYRRLVQLAPSSKTATLLNLGDFLHANDAKNVTPASGHLLDMDGRHPRVLDAAADLLVELVELLLLKHEVVELVYLPGNHDPDVAAALRTGMRLFYRNNPRVIVYNSPGVFWYKRFGKTLLGGTHGHTIKQGDLPGVMAHDRKEDWAASEQRIFFTAHIHHERTVEKHGVRVESQQTLASRDAYATNGGWRSGHSVQCITFHVEEGEDSRQRVNVLAQPHKHKG